MEENLARFKEDLVGFARFSAGARGGHEGGSAARAVAVLAHVAERTTCVGEVVDVEASLFPYEAPLCKRPPDDEWDQGASARAHVAKLMQQAVAEHLQGRFIEWQPAEAPGTWKAVLSPSLVLAHATLCLAGLKHLVKEGTFFCTNESCDSFGVPVDAMVQTCEKCEGRVTDEEPADVNEITSCLERLKSACERAR